MSQMMSQLPRHLLQQQQRLTPQLIQAMDILQLSALALESRIAQEVDSNPALEVVPGDEDLGPGPVEDEGRGDRPEGEQALVVEGDARDFERLDNLVSEYDWIDDESDYRGTKSRARTAEESDVKMEAMANTAARPVSLEEYLLEQWAWMDVDERTRQLGADLIDAIDEHGRLAVALEDFAAQHAPPITVAEAEHVLRRVQELDPPGIAARDLRECLLLQLDALPGDQELPRSIVARHLENLQKNRLPQIAKSLSVSVDDIKQALGVIGRLSLHPGVDAVDRQVPRIVPDVVVEYDEQADEYTVRLTRSNHRELRISREFRELLEQARHDKNARDFVRQKIEQANVIIDALRYRRQRLLQVAEAVVEAQRDFLDHGEQHIKVLRMSDLAVRFGCDPSTVSRTVDEKYMQTPRGIFPLRRFFTGGTESEAGEALGWDSIKAMVQDIVDKEDKSSPLSDDAIVKQLQAQGIDIKRRTVAKYRSQLGIPTGRQRKQY